jgi:pilus assembly protein CpaE
MVPPKAKTRRKPIAVFSSDKTFLAETVSRLNALAIYDVMEGEARAFLAGRPPQGRPTLVVLDIAQGELLTDPQLPTAKEMWGDTPILAVSAELGSDKVRQLVRLGAVDWFRKPVDAKELINSVIQHDGLSKVGESRVSTFISATGGAGATTMALAAAAVLAKKAKAPDETSVVDLDFEGASCSSYLNLVNEFDLDNVVNQPGRLDIELLDVIKLERDPGITLFSFERAEMPFTRNGRDFVLRLLDLAAFRYHDVVIDMPNLSTPWFNDVLRNSNRIFVVCEFNIPSLRQARRLVRRIREQRGNSDAVTIIVNKDSRSFFGRPISRKDAEKIFADKEVHTIARDDALMNEALNRALLPSDISPRSRTVKQIKKLFDELIVDEEKR